MPTYHIHINGIVQGVGFRPLIYQVAMGMQLEGFVKNGSDGVHILFNASKENAQSFFSRVVQQAPSKATIISADLVPTPPQKFSEFSIVVEDDRLSKQVLISPDLATCAACSKELKDHHDRRYRYAFITCTHCGPRYSIINQLPYERHSTSMQLFEMCDTCRKEYNTVNDRRFFSQTNSCSACGITLKLWSSKETVLSNDPAQILSNVKDFIRAGKIVAVKGIGGYLLICDAVNVSTIQTLRHRKNRPSKPFAVLYPDIQAAVDCFETGPEERDLLQGDAAPIVLLYPKKKAKEQLATNALAPGLNRIGVMLPYSPLLHLIVSEHEGPLVATSANISGSPIIYKDEDALSYLFGIADYVVSYNREIVVPQDDSVIQVSKYTRQQIMLRRSRGYVPTFLQYQPEDHTAIVSTGALLKSSFTLSANGNVFVSQYLGSGEGYESQQMYRQTLGHWLNLYRITPSLILADKHPGYFSHAYARELAEIYDVNVKFIQHHEAHFAAVLAENSLLNEEDPILGIIWDGTGLGNDNNIWGGEFFRYQNKELVRLYHFDYFPAIAGDKLALEPRIAALCTAYASCSDAAILRGKFSETEWNNYLVLMQRTKLFSCSAGRIFDAVASVLGLCDKQTYEGEAAMYLQVLAETYIEENGFSMQDSYLEEVFDGINISTSALLKNVIKDIDAGKEKIYIAAKFHYSLACLVALVAEHSAIEKICFTGGVFQNSLLVDWIKQVCPKKYRLYFQKNLSPNDENISFGQLVYYDHQLKSSLTNKRLNRSGELMANGNYTG